MQSYLMHVLLPRLHAGLVFLLTAAGRSHAHTGRDGLKG